MTSRTPRWRGVSPVSSAGPSGISLTLAGGFLATAGSSQVVAQTVATRGREFKHLFERVVFLSRGRGRTRTDVRSNACSVRRAGSGRGGCGEHHVRRDDQRADPGAHGAAGSGAVGAAGPHPGTADAAGPVGGRAVRARAARGGVLG